MRYRTSKIYIVFDVKTFLFQHVRSHSVHGRLVRRTTDREALARAQREGLAAVHQRRSAKEIVETNSELGIYFERSVTRFPTAAAGC